MFRLKTKYADYKDCFIEQHGPDVGAIYDIVSKSEGPIATINIGGGYIDDLPEPLRRPDVMLVKDYSENEGMLDFLKDSGVVKSVLGTVGTGIAITDFLSTASKQKSIRFCLRVTGLIM